MIYKEKRKKEIDKIFSINPTFFSVKSGSWVTSALSSWLRLIISSDN